MPQVEIRQALGTYGYLAEIYNLEEMQIGDQNRGELIAVKF
jgi:hypothetical protein